MRRTALLGLSLLALALLASPGMGYDRWEMDVTTGKPQVLLVKDSSGPGVPFLYFTFKVTNNTGKDRELNLSIIARSDTEKVIDGVRQRIQSRAGFDARALKAITRREKRKLLSMVKMLGTIKAGESKEGVAIFRDLDPEMDRVEFRIHGLIDPIEVIAGKRYFEEKVLVLHYKRPGDEFGHAEDPLIYVKKEWVVEGKRRLLPSAKD
jgi:hypothetical protein